MFSFLVRNLRSSGQDIPKILNIYKRDCSSKMTEFKTLKVTQPQEYVTHVQLNRPEKRNAMNTDFWREMRECFSQLAVDPDCRVVVLSGAGKIFTAGLDLTDNKDLKLQEMTSPEIDAGRKAFFIRHNVKLMQDSFSFIEKCPKPVIAPVHGACIGGGIDMISGCDIRYCSSDTWFSIKEVDLGITADLGTLQRFPKIIGNDSLARELAFTGRKFYADEAKEIGFVSRVFPCQETLLSGAFELASIVASKSPVAVQGTKLSMVFSRDHSVADGLEQVLTWNQAALQSEDIMKAVMSNMEKKKPVFSKL